MAMHTLAECPAWDAQRRVLIQEIGGDLSLPVIVKATADSEDAWKAMVSFCEDVLSQKEAAERDREADSAANPAEGGAGARRRAFARLQ